MCVRITRENTLNVSPVSTHLTQLQFSTLRWSGTPSVRDTSTATVSPKDKRTEGCSTQVGRV